MGEPRPWQGDGPVISDFESMRETQHAIIAMVVKSVKPKRMKWLMDTGCGHNLVGLKVASKLGLNPRMSSEAMTFMTANGITATDQKVDLVIDEMQDTILPFVMEESPSVLSIGKRCAEDGYGFLWMPGEEPSMFNDRKSVIFFVHSISWIGLLV